MTRIILYFLSFLFVLFAGVQYNDPDPVLWMLIYGVVAMVAVLKIYFSKVNLNPLIYTLIVLFLIFAATYVPSFLEYLNQSDKMDLIGKMKAEKPWIEGTRELGGLLIAIAALFYMRIAKV